MPISRRVLLQTTALATLGVGRAARAQDAKFTYKCALNVPVTHPVHLRMAEAAERIRKQTDGEVAVILYPINQLGPDTDMLGHVRAGTLETVIMPGVVLANLVPMASLNSVGFAFKDYPAVWKAMDGGVGDQIRAHIRKTNLQVQEKVWDNGFRHMTSLQPIASPADLVGRKVRVPVSPMLLSLFKALGAAATPINFNELYAALQNQVIDAQENPLAQISAIKLYEVQRYCALTNHVWDGYWFLSNRRLWDAMPPATRKIVEDNIAESALAQRADNEKLAATLQAQLTDLGLRFNTPDIASFRETLRKAGFYVDWKKKFGDEAWAALESEVGVLT